MSNYARIALHYSERPQEPPPREFSVAIEHDGCDTHGPESNLVTVTCTFASGTGRSAEAWYWEDWYQPSDPEPARLQQM